MRIPLIAPVIGVQWKRTGTAMAIAFYFRNCVLLYCSNSVGDWFVFKMDDHWSYNSLLQMQTFCLKDNTYYSSCKNCWWNHLTKKLSKQKVKQPAIECVRIFKSIILPFFCASIAKDL